MDVALALVLHIFLHSVILIVCVGAWVRVRAVGVAVAVALEVCGYVGAW